MIRLFNQSNSALPKLTLTFGLRTLAPLLVILSIWWPDYQHFHIDRTPIPPLLADTLERLPTSEVLREIGGMATGVSLEIPKDKHPETARKILDNILEAPAFLAQPMLLAGWPDDLTRGGLTFQLVVASLNIEDLLIEEFERTGERRFLSVARDRILSFAKWEDAQLKPTAFLWNDHAVAARIPVLVRLWLHLRNDSETTPAQKIALLALVNRSGELLAKDSQFTVQTNHGVVQNIALLQIAAAFPELPGSPQWRRTAQDRLELQLGFYVSKEGVVLEHSAGYHVFGTELLAYALRLFRLNGLEPSERLRSSANGTFDFTRDLLRPDGSLPLFGNTAAGYRHALPTSREAGALPVTRNSPPFPRTEPISRIFPLSGYALWWSTGDFPSQTVIAWAKHDHHGHKHADEPSLHFWSRGYDWITAAGYWPYDQSGYAQANGWTGSNAPHLLGEPTKSPRNARLVASGEKGELRAVDIENLRDSGLRIRRQVVELSPEQLLVLDTHDGAQGPIETMWTIDHRLALRPDNQTHFISSPTDTGDTLHIALANPENDSVRASILVGNRSSFAGWIVVGRNPTAASTLRVEHLAPKGITATLISVGKSEEPESLSISPESNGENWTVQIGQPSEHVTVERRGSTLEIISPRQRQQIDLVEPPPTTAEKQALRSAMSEAIARYPHWRDLGNFRQRLYIAIPVLWAVSEAIIALLSARRRWPNRANLALIFAWTILGYWLYSYYLR